MDEDGGKIRTDAKFARMEIIKSGIVLKKQMMIKKIEPTVLLRAISDLDLAMFSQI
jgi:hypothetical protein